MSFFIISKCQAQRETEIRLRIRPRLHVRPLLRVRHRVRLLRVRQNLLIPPLRCHQGGRVMIVPEVPADSSKCL